MTEARMGYGRHGLDPRGDASRPSDEPEAPHVHSERDICVLVVDEQPLLRMGLTTLLRRAGMRVSGVPDPGAVAALATDPGAHVVVMNLDMDTMAGVEAVRRVTATMPGARVVAIARAPDHPSVLGALRAGACAVVVRGSTTHELVTAIRAAADGESALSPAIASALVRRLRSRAHDQSSRPSLTTREAEVLRLITRGWDNVRIAEALYVGRGTVKHHISSILLKLGVDNRIQAAVRAVELDLLDG